MAGRVSGVLKALGYTFPHEHRKQIVALDDEFHAIELEITNLKAEKLSLESEVNPLHREIERLQEIIESDTAAKEREARAAKAKGEHLDENQEKILKFLAQVSLTREKYARMEAIAMNIGLNPIHTDVLVRGLMEQDYIFNILQMGVGAKYTLDDKGKEYVVEHKLV